MDISTIEGDGVKRFRCPNCPNRSYGYKRNLTKHLRYECGEQRPFNCTLCPFSTKQKFTLKLHVFKRHTCFPVANKNLAAAENCDGGKFRCSDCGKCYRHKANLYKHKRYECGDQRPFSCTLCPCSFKQKFSLKRHLLIVHKDTLSVDT
ncbi:hypothetical protein J6590_014839 [Homalodisca vitripennis]|nr:hypothetical protein J6590_014839 [Homalodisca vitripennis]